MEELEIKLIVDNKEFNCTLDADSVIWSKDKICNSSDFMQYPIQEHWMEDEYSTSIYNLVKEKKDITIKLK